MFGIDTILSTIQGLFERIANFFTLTREKGVGGAIETMATNTINEFAAKAEQTLATIPATLEKGSKLAGDIASFAAQGKLPAAPTTGPEGNAPATTPATPPAPAAPAPTV